MPARRRWRALAPGALAPAALAPLAPATAALATAVVLAACGSSSPGRSSASAGSGSGSGSGSSQTQIHSQSLRFARCMRANGVPNFPDPTAHQFGVKLAAGPNGPSVNGVPVHAPAFQGAMAVCQQYLPQPPAPTASQLAQYRAKAVQFGRCMRSHGINIPDPTIGPGPGGHGIAREIDIPTGMTQNSPAYETARRTCESRTRF